MKKIFVLSSLLLISCAGGKNYIQKEEKRRARLEMQSIMDMLYTREIPPVEFEFNSATLRKSSHKILDMIAELLLRHRTMKLVVVGHTDDVGSEEYNKSLSLNRAQAVKDYIVSKGVYPTSIRIYGYGESRPVTREQTEKARALNRRVEFILTTREWETVY